MPKKKLTKAVGYIRRSNLNEESKGSFHRQEAAIRDYAKRSGYEVVEFFRDGGKSGTTSIEERDGLTALFARCKAEGITVAICQESGRLARTLIQQMLIIEKAREASIELLDCSGEKLSDDSCSQRVMISQILGAIKQYDRSETIAKMKAGRERVRAAGGRAEGRPRFGEECAAEAKIIKRIRHIRRSHKNCKGVPVKWTKVTTRINDEGFRNRSGGEFTSAYVRKLAKENAIA